MSLSRMAGATTAPAVLTYGRTPDSVEAIVGGLQRSIRRPAEVVIGFQGDDPTAGLDAPFVVRGTELSEDELEGAGCWAPLARVTLADKLVCLGPRFVPGPGLVGAFEHTLERVDALVHGPVQALLEPIEDCDPQRLRPARPDGARLEVERRHSHLGAANFACRRRTLLTRICRVEATGSTPDEEPLIRAERAGVPIAWQAAAVAFVGPDDNASDDAEPPRGSLHASE